MGDAPTVTSEDIVHLARLAGLSCAGREELVSETLQDLLAMVRRIDDVPMGDIPPATAFDPRIHSR